VIGTFSLFSKHFLPFCSLDKTFLVRLPPRLLRLGQLSSPSLSYTTAMWNTGQFLFSVSLVIRNMSCTGIHMRAWNTVGLSHVMSKSWFYRLFWAPGQMSVLCSLTAQLNVNYYCLQVLHGFEWNKIKWDNESWRYVAKWENDTAAKCELSWKVVPADAAHANAIAAWLTAKLCVMNQAVTTNSL